MKLETRRHIAAAAALLVVLTLLATSHTPRNSGGWSCAPTDAYALSVQDKQADWQGWFYEGIFPVLDTARGRVWVYRDGEDTTGAVVDTMIFQAADSSWKWSDIPFGDYFLGIYYHTTGGPDTVFANKLFFGADSMLPDSAIDRSTVFDGRVIPGGAMELGSVWPIHLNTDSQYVASLDSGSAVSVYALPSEVTLDSEFGAHFGGHFADSLEAGLYDAVLDSATALWDSSFYAVGCSVYADSALTVTGTRWDDGSGAIDGTALAASTVGTDAMDIGTGAGELNAPDLPEFGTLTKTAGKMLVADGGDYEARTITGDGWRVDYLGAVTQNTNTLARKYANAGYGGTQTLTAADSARLVSNPYITRFYVHDSLDTGDDVRGGWAGHPPWGTGAGDRVLPCGVWCDQPDSISVSMGGATPTAGGLGFFATGDFKVWWEFTNQ